LGLVAPCGVYMYSSQTTYLHPALPCDINIKLIIKF